MVRYYSKFREKLKITPIECQLWKEILSPSCRILVDIRRILMEGRRSLTDEYGEKRNI